jgi:hypothetical protein
MNKLYNQQALHKSVIYSLSKANKILILPDMYIAVKNFIKTNRI